MKYNEKLNNLIQRVSTKAALLLLGGVLFAGCGDGDKDKDDGGSKGAQNPLLAANNNLSEDQKARLNDDAYRGLLSRVGISAGGWDSLSKRFNRGLNSVPTQGGDDAAKSALTAASKAINGGEAGLKIALDSALHTNNAVGFWDIAFGSLTRDKVAEFVTLPGDKSKVVEEFSGHIGSAVEAALGKGLLAKASTVAASKDVGDRDKNVLVGAGLLKEAHEALGLLNVLFDAAKQFCDCFNGKYDIDGAKKVIDGLSETKKLDRSFSIGADASKELKKETSPNRDLSDSEKAAVSKLIDGLNEELDEMNAKLTTPAKLAQEEKNNKKGKEKEKGK